MFSCYNLLWILYYIFSYKWCHLRLPRAGLRCRCRINVDANLATCSLSNRRYRSISTARACRRGPLPRRPAKPLTIRRSLYVVALTHHMYLYVRRDLLHVQFTATSQYDSKLLFLRIIWVQTCSLSGCACACNRPSDAYILASPGLLAKKLRDVLCYVAHVALSVTCYAGMHVVPAVSGYASHCTTRQRTWKLTKITLLKSSANIEKLHKSGAETIACCEPTL
jgi:hypothetical protein